MIRLSIDQGNSFTKIGVFDDGDLIESFSENDDYFNLKIREVISTYKPKETIFSSVRLFSEKEIISLINSSSVLFLNSEVPLPIKPEYETLHTLGNDRIANAAGANHIFPFAGSLIVDCGTCITYTVVKNSKLLGGAISPGVEMRYKALQHYTSRLPIYEVTENTPDILGKSTQQSIGSGVQRAIILEVDGMIREFCSHLALQNVILTGGSTMFFERHLKSPIFARPYLTLIGLNEILRYNHS
jgi:type III pantothenate kinase